MDICAKYAHFMKRKALRIWRKYFKPNIKKPHEGYGFNVQVPLEELAFTKGYPDIWALAFYLEQVAKEQGHTIYYSSHNGGTISPGLETTLLACGGFCFYVKVRESMGY
ncbi:MAG: hypothetical protein WC243_01320 [Patescibacteria group bacterium]